MAHTIKMSAPILDLQICRSAADTWDNACWVQPRTSYVCKVGRWRDCTWALARRLVNGKQPRVTERALVAELVGLRMLENLGGRVRLTERGLAAFDTTRQTRRWPTARDGHCNAAPLRVRATRQGQWARCAG